MGLQRQGLGEPNDGGRSYGAEARREPKVLSRDVWEKLKSWDLCDSCFNRAIVANKNKGSSQFLRLWCEATTDDKQGDF